MDADKQEMVDKRVCRILLHALQEYDGSADDEEALITHHLADEWACLEVAAAVVAPLYGLDGTDQAIITRLARAAHGALKAECQLIGLMTGPTDD